MGIEVDMNKVEINDGDKQSQQNLKRKADVQISKNNNKDIVYDEDTHTPTTNIGNGGGENDEVHENDANGSLSPRRTVKVKRKWVCYLCDTTNDYSNTSCIFCSEPMTDSLTKENESAIISAASLPSKPRPNNIKQQSTSPSNWMCKSCDTENEESDEICLNCDEPKPSSLSKGVPPTSFLSGTPSTPTVPTISTPTNANTSIWKCECCEAENPLSSVSCSICLVNKPKPKDSQPTPPPSQTTAKPGFFFGTPPSIPTTTTAQATQPAAKPGFFFGTPSSTQATPAPSSTNTSIWKCECCEAENPSSSVSCSICLANKPKPKDSQPTPPPSQTTQTTAKPGFFFGTPPSIPTTTTPQITQPAAKPEFFFGTPSTPTIPTISTPTNANTSIWKCECCETENPLSSVSCSICLVNKPKPKDSQQTLPPSQTTAKPGFFFGTPSSTQATPAPSSANASIWKCECCEAENPSSSVSCSICLANKPKPKDSQPTPPPSQTTQTTQAAFFFGTPPK